MIPFTTDLLHSTHISWNDIYDWIYKNDQYYQNLCAKSDSYADIEELQELQIVFKLVPNAGRGLLKLRDPEKFPNIFNPETEEDCFFICLAEAGCLFQTGKTRHIIKNELDLVSQFQ